MDTEPNTSTAPETVTDAADQPENNHVDPNEPPVPEGGAKIFVGNLPYSTNQDAFAKMFAKYDPVHCRLAESTRSPEGQSSGYGFVILKTDASVRSAIADLHQTLLGERRLNIQYALDRPRRRRPAGPRKTKTETATGASTSAKNGGKDSSKKQAGKPRRTPKAKRPAKNTPVDFSNDTVHISNLSFESNEDSVRKFFEQKADIKVEQVVIARFKNGRSRGFAFVRVTGPDQQTAVINSCDNQVLDDRILRVKPSHARQTLEPSPGSATSTETGDAQAASTETAAETS